MEPSDLIAVARTLAGGGNASNPSGTTDTELRRAVSCSYYAIFHALCRAYADVIVGSRVGSQLEQELWNMAYRTMEHGPVRSKCNDADRMRRFSQNIRRFAAELVDLQQHRHRADYDPGAVFTLTQVNQIIDDAADALTGFNNAPPEDIRMFIAYLTSRPRR